MANDLVASNVMSGRIIRSGSSFRELLRLRSKEILDINGRSLSAEEYVVEKILEAIIYGKVQFPGDAKERMIDMKDWRNWVTEFINIVDPPSLALTTSGGLSPVGAGDEVKTMLADRIDKLIAIEPAFRERVMSLLPEQENSE